MRVRIRRIAKWGCLSLGSVMVVMAVVSNWWVLGCTFQGLWRIAGGHVAVEISTSKIAMGWFAFPDAPPTAQGWVERGHRSSFRYFPDLISTRGAWLLTVPLLNAAILPLTAGAIFWRLDRSRAAHECPKCRYDRRGLAEGAVCPECGAG